jgi:hypothetical protein
MSDNSISIVPKKSNYPDNLNKAKEILDWLVSLDIVKSSTSDCVLGQQEGHAISDGARSVTANPEDLPFDLITNGLAINTSRQVFDTGQNEIETLVCPACKQDIVSADWGFIGEWAEENNDFITCPSCKTKSDIQKFSFQPEWGFSNLGFTFWNWPGLTDNFISAFKEKLDAEVAIVYQHI